LSPVVLGLASARDPDARVSLTFSRIGIVDMHYNCSLLRLGGKVPVLTGLQDGGTLSKSWEGGIDDVK
jgi:hypothetical protein